MKREAEEHAEEDKKKREEIEIRNRADSAVSATERTLKEVGDKVPAEQKAKAEGALSEAKDALKGEDIGRIQATSEKLMQVMNEISSAMYQQAGPQGAPGCGPQGCGSQAGAGDGPAAGGAKNDGAVDADYEVIDDEKDKK